MTHDAHGDAPRVRVVVLNWNSAEHTRRCVRSLTATEYPADRLEVVVVDNGSVDGSVPVLQTVFPDLRLLENGANLGFAEGCNRALRDTSEFDAVALVNNDATVEPGWLWPLVRTLQDHPDVGAVSPKMLLAAEFMTVVVHAAEHGGALLRSATVDGIDVTAKVLPGDGTDAVLDQSVGALHHDLRCGATGELHVPAPTGARTVELTFDAPGATVVGGSPVGDLVWTVPADAPRTYRINSVGTTRTPQGEGLDRRFGEADRALAAEVVDGWSGGGVLLRSDYLRSVGFFDPRYFAYYEDADLSWRGTRRGWRTMTAPTSVLFHQQGATAGPTWPGFFFLNYRNWLTTTLRNGDRGQVLVAFRTAHRYAWSPWRAGVLGRLRRFQRPDWSVAGQWARVVVGLWLRLPDVVSSRVRGRRVGTSPTGKVRSRLQPPSWPRTPVPRPGGPVVVLLDVTTLPPGATHAQLSAVARALVTAPDDAVELVPVVRTGTLLRRLTREETARLLDPEAHGVAPTEDDPRSDDLEVLGLAPGTVVLGGDGTVPVGAAAEGVAAVPLDLDRPDEAVRAVLGAGRPG